MAHITLPENVKHLYRSTIKVRWGDMDALGHVNNTRFFQYFEDVRVGWLRATVGESWQPDGAGPVVVHTACQFKKPVVHPATLHIDLYSAPPGRSSIETFYEVYREGDQELSARGQASVVWIDLSTGKPTSLPETFHTAYEASAASV